MVLTGETFTISYQEQLLKIEVYKDGRELLYRAWFPDGGSLFFIKAFSNSVNPFWTSIPEGRKTMAEELGTLIEQLNQVKTASAPQPRDSSKGRTNRNDTTEAPTLF